MCTDTVLGTQYKHPLEKINAQLIDLRQDCLQVLRCIHLEVWLVFGELGNARPRSFGGRAHDAEDADDLVLVGRAGEERSTGVHLGHDASGGPDVDAGIVGSTAKQDVWGAVPQRYNLVRECVDGNSKGTSKTKVAELQHALGADQQVLGLEISVQDAVLVAKVNTLQQLVHEGLDGHVLQSAPIAVGVHVFLQIAVHVFKHQHELVLRVDHIVKGNDVLMFELLHERDLPNGGRWCALLGIEVNLLERDQLTRLSISSLEYLLVAPY